MCWATSGFHIDDLNFSCCLLGNMSTSPIWHAMYTLCTRVCTRICTRHVYIHVTYLAQRVHSTNACTLARCHSFTHTLSLSRSRSLSLFLSLPHSLHPSLSLSFSLSRARALSFSLSSFSLFLSLFLRRGSAIALGVLRVHCVGFE